MSKLINGRYQLHNILGTGSMGTVHRATDRLTGDTVALKQVPVSTIQLDFSSCSITDADYARRVALANEFQLMAGLRHPHIVSVQNYGFDAQQMPFFTMTYLREAQTILQAGLSLDSEGKIALIQQLLQALVYLHRQGIIHRDLKPRNVLVSEQKVRVLDFGLSVHQNRAQTGSGGTLLYMAPELLRREKASIASDLYAVGVMAYELLDGDHPFDTTSGKFAQQVQDDVPDLTHLDVEKSLVKVIGRLLAKKPNERYTYAEDCLRDISAVLGETAPVESRAIRESYLQAAAFVGRKTEMVHLETALAEADKGHGSMWLIGGESGVGKSRFIEEFRTHALVSGWQVLTGQGVAGGGFPYQLWQEIVPNLALNVTLTDLEAAVLCEIAPNLPHILEREILRPPKLQGRAAQTRIVNTLIAVLQRQPQPMLLLLDDLQWTKESLAPIKQLLALEKMGQLLVVGTYRFEERPSLSDELAGANSLILERLNETEVTRLSQIMLGQIASTPNVVSLLIEETEGNTFFIVEVMRALAEEAGCLDKIGTMTLPTSILSTGMQQLLQRRIQKVPAQDQLLLQLAAVAGRQLDLRLLHVLAGSKDVDEWLQRASETAVLTIRNNQWQFAHDKLRETILTDLANEQRRALHRQVAEVIEYVYPDNENYDQVLLEHWHQAADLDKEMQYLPPVARQLIKITADYEHANQILERGLQTLSANDTRRIILYNLQAEAYFQQGNFAVTAKLAKEGLQLALQIGDQIGIADSYHNLGQALFRQSHYDQARDCFQQGLEIRQTLCDQHGIGSSFIGLGILAFQQGHYEEARDFLQKCLDIQKITGNQYGTAAALNNLGLVADHQGRYEEARSLHQQSLAIRQAIEDQWSVSQSLNNIGSVLYRQGNYKEAVSVYQQSLDIRRTLQVSFPMAYSLNNLGFVYLKLQDEKAQSTLLDALALAQQFHYLSVILESVVGCAELYLQRGQSTFAGELAGFVQHHPALHSEAQIRLDDLLSLLREILAPTELEAAIDRGQTLELDNVIETLLTTFGDRAPDGSVR